MPAAAFDDAHPLASPLHRMAERIARNREVLGLHYPTDSRAGKSLAAAVFPLLKKCPSLQGSNGVLARAKAEWSYGS
ncbi:MAG: hypothetical protein IPK78_07910 [Rhodospirillales bacterium]|nr:hypothetical protein [Rhodospirillales bacterium]